MELHHKLRRDPSWHPNACNLCGQLGHQASQCTNGTINWRQIYGDDAFILRQPVFWSDIEARIKAKQVDHTDLEKQAKEFAKTRAQALGLSYDEVLNKAEQTHKEMPSYAKEKPKDEEPLPPGWATATDSSGRTYYWHKKTQKTQWDRPSAETPAS